VKVRGKAGRTRYIKKRPFLSRFSFGGKVSANAKGGKSFFPSSDFDTFNFEAKKKFVTKAKEKN